MKFKFTLKRNGMQIGAKGIGNFSWLLCGFFFLKGHIYEKTPFHSPLVVGNLLFTNSNLELSSKRMTYGA
jgi:hypothetical protein